MKVGAHPIFRSIAVGCLSAILFGVAQYLLLFHGPAAPFHHDSTKEFPYWFVDERRSAWLRAGLPLVLLLGLAAGWLSRHRNSDSNDFGGVLVIGLPIISALFSIFPEPMMFGVAIPFLVAGLGLICGVRLLFQRKVAFAIATVTLNLLTSFASFFYAVSVFALRLD